MPVSPLPPLPTDWRTSLVNAYKQTLDGNSDANLADHLPSEDHPLYLAALTELVRFDLAISWTRNQPRFLSSYRDRFPAVFADPLALLPVALEEYRQRRFAGETVSPEEYASGYGVDTEGWPIDNSSLDGTGNQRYQFGLGRAGPSTVLMGKSEARKALMVPPIDDQPNADCLSQLVNAEAKFPEPGTTFLGFRLVEEMGRGAFGRVYLALQGDLAARPVALKVAWDVTGESQTLAQMQHTNIVPIYSVHRKGPFQAVCMPFFGRTTLADVVRYLGGRRGLPNSGRELRSTLEWSRSGTVPSRGTSQPSTDPGLAHYPRHHPGSHPSMHLTAGRAWKGCRTWKRCCAWGGNSPMDWLMRMPVAFCTAT